MPSHSYLNTVLLRSEDVCFIFPFIHLFFWSLFLQCHLFIFLTQKVKWTNIFVLFIDKNLSASRSNSYRPTNKCPGPAKTSLTWHTLTPRISRYGGEEGGHIPHYPIHICTRKRRQSKNANVPTNMWICIRKFATNNHVWNKSTANERNNDTQTRHSQLFFTRGLVSCRHRPWQWGGNAGRHIVSRSFEEAVLRKVMTKWVSLNRMTQLIFQIALLAAQGIVQT